MEGLSLLEIPIVTRVHDEPTESHDASPEDFAVSCFVLHQKKIWKQRVVKVAFPNDIATTRLDLLDAIRQVACQWCEHGNLLLQFQNEAGEYYTWSPSDTVHSAEIRVSFDKLGTYSYVGTDSVSIAKPGQGSLNLGHYHKALPYQWQATILHEFGHALGFEHEHQSPNGDFNSELRWDDDQGYELTLTPHGEAIPDPAGRHPGIVTLLGNFPNRWTRDQVVHNLQQFDKSSMMYLSSIHDPKSIMHYAFDACMFKKGSSSRYYIPKPTTLSDGDKKAFSLAYPRDPKIRGPLDELRKTLENSRSPPKALRNTVLKHLDTTKESTHFGWAELLGHAKLMRPNPFELSDEQNAVLEFVKSGNGSCIVQACAGAGKTTVLVECIKAALADSDSVRVVTFARRDRKTLKGRLPGKEEIIHTFHSLAKHGLRSACKKKFKPTEGRKQQVISNLSPSVEAKYSSMLCNLVGLAYNCRETDFTSLAQQFQIPLPLDVIKRVSDVQQRLTQVRDLTGEADFDELLAAAADEAVRLPQYKLLFVDEAQDINPVQLVLLRKWLAPGGRLIAVGDCAQAIYQFRGALGEALSEIKKQFSAREFPLTQNNRSSSAVIKEASQFGPKMHARPGAPEGDCAERSWQHALENVRLGDYVIGDQNCQVVRFALDLMSRSPPRRSLVTLGDRRVVDMLQDVFSQSSQERALEARDGLVKKIKDYATRNEKRWMYTSTRDFEQTVQIILDKQGLEGGRQFLNSMASVSEVYGEKGEHDDQQVLCCTIWGSKGGEADTVYFLSSSTQQPSAQKNQEYVAITRARLNFYRVTDVPPSLSSYVGAPAAKSAGQSRASEFSQPAKKTGLSSSPAKNPLLAKETSKKKENTSASTRRKRKASSPSRPAKK